MSQESLEQGKQHIFRKFKLQHEGQEQVFEMANKYPKKKTIGPSPV